jgi:epsilon-lactone hydrolase
MTGGNLTISSQSREYFKQLHETPAFGATGFDLVELREIMAVRREPTISGVECQNREILGMSADWVIADDADPTVRLLYLHGGGYVSGSGVFYLAMAAHISAAAGCAVLLPDYHLAPEHPFPAALEDCICAHEWMLRRGSEGAAPARATFIGGDSAGGGLTLATLLALRDRGLALPKGGIAVSPFADMTLAGESIRSEGGLDPIMSPHCLPDFVALYLGDADARDPLVSPAFGDYTGIPPLLFQVGEHEVIRDDSVQAADKARAGGVEVTLEIWPGMFHVFQSHEPLLPEAKEAVDHIGEFVRTHAD